MHATATVVIYAVSFGLLAWAGVIHGRHGDELALTLEKHGTFPHRLAASVAAVVAAGELTIGICGFVTAILGLDAALAVLGVGATLVYGSYAVYSGVLMRARPGVPCGCSPRRADPISLITVIRAGVLAVVTLLAVTLGGAGVQIESVPEAVFLLSASGALALLAWGLPAALSEPLSLQQGGMQ